jgi:hypothetical protein
MDRLESYAPTEFTVGIQQAPGADSSFAPPPLPRQPFSLALERTRTLTEAPTAVLCADHDSSGEDREERSGSYDVSGWEQEPACTMAPPTKRGYGLSDDDLFVSEQNSVVDYSDGDDDEEKEYRERQERQERLDWIVDADVEEVEDNHAPSKSGSDQARWDSLPFVEDEEMLATCDEVEEATRSKATQAEQQASASAISSSESFRYAPWKPIHSRRSPDVSDNVQAGSDTTADYLLRQAQLSSERYSPDLWSIDGGGSDDRGSDPVVDIASDEDSAYHSGSDHGAPYKSHLFSSSKNHTQNDEHSDTHSHLPSPEISPQPDVVDLTRTDEEESEGSHEGDSSVEFIEEVASWTCDACIERIREAHDYLNMDSDDSHRQRDEEDEEDVGDAEEAEGEDEEGEDEEWWCDEGVEVDAEDSEELDGVDNDAWFCGAPEAHVEQESSGDDSETGAGSRSSATSTRPLPTPPRLIAKVGRESFSEHLKASRIDGFDESDVDDEPAIIGDDRLSRKRPLSSTDFEWTTSVATSPDRTVSTSTSTDSLELRQKVVVAPIVSAVPIAPLPKRRKVALGYVALGSTIGFVGGMVATVAGLNMLEGMLE